MIEIPEQTLQLLRSLRNEQERLEEKQNIVVQVLMDTADIDVASRDAVRLDLDEGVIDMRPEGQEVKGIQAVSE